jgi:hypothetical protein
MRGGLSRRGSRIRALHLAEVLEPVEEPGDDRPEGVRAPGGPAYTRHG